MCVQVQNIKSLNIIRGSMENYYYTCILKEKWLYIVSLKLLLAKCKSSSTGTEIPEGKS